MDITAAGAAAVVGTNVAISVVATTTTTTTTTTHTFLTIHILHSVVTDHRLIGIDNPMYGCNDARRNITQARKMQIVVYTYKVEGDRVVLRLC